MVDCCRDRDRASVLCLARVSCSSQRLAYDAHRSAWEHWKIADVSISIGARRIRCPAFPRRGLPTSSSPHSSRDCRREASVLPLTTRHYGGSIRRGPQGLVCTMFTLAASGTTSYSTPEDLCTHLFRCPIFLLSYYLRIPDKPDLLSGVPRIRRRMVSSSQYIFVRRAYVCLYWVILVDRLYMSFPLGWFLPHGLQKLKRGGGGRGKPKN